MDFCFCFRAYFPEDEKNFGTIWPSIFEPLDFIPVYNRNGEFIIWKAIEDARKNGSRDSFFAKKSPLIGFSQDYSTYHSYQLGYSELNKNGPKVHCKSFFHVQGMLHTIGWNLLWNALLSWINQECLQNAKDFFLAWLNMIANNFSSVKLYKKSEMPSKLSACIDLDKGPLFLMKQKSSIHCK